MKDIFGFAEHQDNCSYGLGYKLASQRINDYHVISHRAGATNADNFALAGRVFIEDLSSYVPHYFPSKLNQNVMLGHFVSKAPTEVSYNKRSSYMKNVTTENNWTFEFGVGVGLDIAIFVKVGFMQGDQFINNIKIMIHFLHQM